MGEFKRNITKGLFWSAIDKYSNLIIGIGISMILARLLTPYDYGIVAIATVFINFLSIFTSIGIGPAVIQKNNLSQNDLNNIFTFTALIGLLCAAITFLSSWFVAKIYENPILVPVLQIFSIGVFFGALNMVPSAMMAKNMKFKEMATRSLLFQLFFGIIGVISAYCGAGVYALICPPIASSIFTFFYNNHFYPVKININFSIAPIKKIFSFSSYLFLFELLTYFSRNVDKIIIGKSISANALGYYEKSYRLMQLPLQNITAVIYPVLQPVLSEFQDNMKEMANKYTRIAAIIAAIGFPICVCLFYCAHGIIVIMFGEQWLSAIPTFKIMAFSIPFMMLLNPTGPIYLACNASKSLFLTGIINTLTTVSGFIIAVIISNSIESIAWAYTITVFLNAINSYCRLYYNVMCMSMNPLLKNLVHPLICSLLIFAALYNYELIHLDIAIYIDLIARISISCLIALIYYNIAGIINIKDYWSKIKMQIKNKH